LPLKKVPVRRTGAYRHKKSPDEEDQSFKRTTKWQKWFRNLHLPRALHHVKIGVQVTFYWQHKVNVLGINLSSLTGSKRTEFLHIFLTEIRTPDPFADNPVFDSLHQRAPAHAPILKTTQDDSSKSLQYIVSQTQVTAVNTI